MSMPLSLDSRGASSAELSSIGKTLSTNFHRGLTSDEAEKRLSSFGENKIEEYRKKGIFSTLLGQLKEPMILLLVIVAVLYTIFGNVADSFVIVIIVFLVVAIETFNVSRAQKSINALKDMTTPTAHVLRDGIIIKVKSAYLVPGDIVQIISGERVPADGRLLESYNLKIDESTLTGESLPVLKDSDALLVGENLADMTNMAFSGTLVVQGSSSMVITSTGKKTEIGKISRLVEEAEEIETPLEKSVNFLTKILASLAVIFSIVFPIIGYFEGQTINDMLLTGLSMAFATVPEELPVLISITLAIGAFTLARHNAVVKNLKAAETLGSVTVIATDKTGTLTENKMAVSTLYGHGEELTKGTESERKFLEQAVLATGTLGINAGDSTSFKDPMEISVLEYAENNGVRLNETRKTYTLAEEFSFDNTKKLSSYLYAKNDRTFALFVSGAPEVVLERSQNIFSGKTSISLTSRMRKEVEEEVGKISSYGERVIGLATGVYQEFSDNRDSLESGLTFIGLISFADPPREGVSEAILQCQTAGINVIMVTGDHPNTAKAIADKVGIANSGEVIDGRQMNRMDDEKLAATLTKHSIFARITSEDKFRIVSALQKAGEVVAVTGDGVNDSPALQKAEIGIAMGVRGTEVARESSDMILLDDNFSTIVDAVHEGRKIRYTLRKSLIYEVSIKLALVMILAIPLLLSIPFPFSPIQIIVMEMMMDFGAMGGFLYEREENNFLKLTSEKNERELINRNTLSFVTVSAIAISAAVIGLYLYLYYTSTILIRAQTAAFAVWMITQIFLAHNLRTERQPIFLKGFLSNRILSLWGVLVLIGLLIITAVPELQVLLHTIYLTNWDWVLILLVSFVSTFWIELRKFYWQISGKRGNRTHSAE